MILSSPRSWTVSHPRRRPPPPQSPCSCIARSKQEQRPFDLGSFNDVSLIRSTEPSTPDWPPPFNVVNPG
ncbi:predicted protein [Streptomyces viridochromogenes DSM 40736]|uniref:Predicted protein n=1 Tax=Streptomyces viridochromogenes (strain DSM 40736 / JCM 4977 / BCRC 1201 / Tue 494) TaxID=591159 RepID=D9X1T5_STRVT|nr:predicted protein [Streptomyces viridochromogenes DSM 40736]